METQAYLEERKEIHVALLEYLNNSTNEEENYENFKNYIKDHNIYKEKNEFKELLILLLKISNNHFRSHSFFNKIKRILIDFKDEIQLKFTNFEIFNFFHRNKQAILFLIEKRIIKIDESIFNIMKKVKYKNFCFLEFFYLEIESFLSPQIKQEIIKKVKELNDNNIEEFDKKRKLGENDDFICHLIRNDLIDEFISQMNQNNLPLSYQIQPSIYETNIFLISNRPSLIQYSAFFGSIQIFKYLYLNGMKTTPILFNYAIHGENPEIIHFLEQNKDKKAVLLFDEYINESIKCHHKEITNYFINKLTKKFNENSINVSVTSLKYHNYFYFPSNLCNENVFYYLCKYNYINLVKLLLQTKKININCKNNDVFYNFE